MPRSGINWRRFAIAVAVPAATAGAIVFGMANGAIAAQFAVSGQTFKISADRLEGEGFSQYSSLVTDEGGKTHPVATAAISKAKLTNLCQSVRVPNMPVSILITAGAGDKSVRAKDLLIDMTELRGDATFTKINIGQDAATLDAAGPTAHGEAGSFGQQADKILIENVRQVSYSTSAGSFELAGLKLEVDVATEGDPKECF
jgi:Family of unknown function (DUF6230)